MGDADQPADKARAAGITTVSDIAIAAVKNIPAADTSDEPIAVFKKRGAKGKANLRKRPATPPSDDHNNGNENDSGFSSTEDDSGQRVKRRKKTSAVVTASSKTNTNAAAAPDLAATVFRTDRDAARDLDATRRDATKASNWFDEGLSAKDLLGSTRPLNKDKERKEDDAPDGTYRGLANRTSYIQKNPDMPSRAVGPVRAPTNIRTVTITDMAPDVCKDYKNTGFCGFGDNCKFLHAREDYQHGWQLDKEWEKVTQGKKVIGGTVVASADRSLNKDDEEAAAEAAETEKARLENIPFCCILCRGPYKSPVVTRCGHYFCEACALKRYKRDPTCGACGLGTNGVFNAAKRLQKILDRNRARAAKERQAAIAAGEDVSPLGSDEEGYDAGGED